MCRTTRLTILPGLWLARLVAEPSVSHRSAVQDLTIRVPSLVVTLRVAGLRGQSCWALTICPVLRSRRASLKFPLLVLMGLCTRGSLLVMALKLMRLWTRRSLLVLMPLDVMGLE